MDNVDGLIRSLESAHSEDTRSSLKKEVDFQLAKIGATTGVYVEKAKKAKNMVAQADDLAGTAIKHDKKVSGLSELGKRILDFFPGS